MADTGSVRELDLLHERLCLDFTNTAGTQPANRSDFLNRYERLVEWAQETELLEPEGADFMIKEAAENPEKAQAALKEAVAVRDTIYRILSAVAADRRPEDSDMRAFNKALQQAFPHLELRSDDQDCHWNCSGDLDDPLAMLWPVVWNTAELLKSPQLKQVRECAGEDCNWLFMDTSKNHSRRWCSMQDCGNRAKARTHYQRARGGD